MFGTTGATFSSVVASILGIFYLLEWLLSGMALIIFFVGLVKFIGSAGSTKSQKEGYVLMVWGLIALFVIFSIQGILWLMCGFVANGACTSYYTAGAPT